MRRPHAFLILVAAFATTLAPAPLTAQAGTAPVDSVKRIAIRRLLAVQRTDSLMLAGVEEAFAKRTPTPDMPASFLDSLRSRIRRDIGQFVERLVPVYDSLYTASEINELLNFYQTRLGRRLLETQPRLAEAIMLLSKQWGMEEAGQVIVDLARHPPPPPPKRP
jgi:hypothetical protein